MSISKVAHVDVITNRRAVRSLIVTSKNLYLGQNAKRGLNHARNQVRLWIVLFASVALRIGSRGIEIAKDHPTQAVGLGVPVQHAFDEQLGFAVGVYRSLRMFFADR